MQNQNKQNQSSVRREKQPSMSVSVSSTQRRAGDFLFGENNG